MTYKALPTGDLPELISRWMEQATVYGPLPQGDFVEFRPLSEPAEIALNGAVNSRYPPKSLFLPQSEVMFRAAGDDLVPTAEEVAPTIILAIRPCDARALQLLDTVFLEGQEDPYWRRKRDETAVVAMGCPDPCETCFCTTVGSGPFDSRGADVLLTQVGDVLMVEAVSDKGDELVAHVPDATPEQVEAMREIQATAARQMKRPFEPEGIKQKLYDAFDGDFWKEVQQSCLGCGICTFLCPTCFCFDIVDEAQRGERVRNWDTCMFRLYSLEASGHNPRATNRERTRQRIMHKYAYWLELINEIGCTGCGRCVRYCPVNLDIRHIVREAQDWEET